MPARLRPRLTFANVCSFLALLLALGTGGAYAADTVFSTDIVDGEVKTADIDNNAVTTAKIRANGVREPDIQDGAVGGAAIATSAVGTSGDRHDAVQATEVADGAIDSGEIADNTLGSVDIAASAIGISELGSNAVGTDEIAAGAVGSSEIGSNAVGADEIASGVVGGSEIASNAVTGGDVANESLTAADLNGVDVNGTITVSAGFANGTCANLNLNVPGAEIGDGVVLSLRGGSVPAGMLIEGVGVLVNDQVVAKACNFTGAASPAINQAPIRLMTFD